MERDKRTKAKEEYVVVLDFLKNGYSSDNRPFHMKEPIIQCIGKDFFVLLELVAKPGVTVNPHEEVYIGDGERDKVAPKPIEKRMNPQNGTTNFSANEVLIPLMNLLN